MFDRIRQGLARSLLSSAFKNPEQMTAFGAQFLSPNSMGGAPPRIGSKELLAAYTEMPWLRAIVNKVGRSVGSVTWRLYVKRDGATGRATRAHKLQRADFENRKLLLKQSETQGNLQEIEEHPLLDLLFLGNNQLLGKVVFQLTQQHLDLVGEAFWLFERDGLGVPVNIWPLPPDWIRNIPAKGFPFYHIKIGASEFDIPMSEILPFIDPDPLDPYGRGTGIAKSLADELETDEYAAKHLKNFFYNRARPDLIIYGDNLSPTDTKRLEERWTEKHRSFWNAFKPHFLNRKVEIKELGMTFEQLQMVEIRKHERDTIIQVYGFPPEKFGIVNESKRSTIAAADVFWRQDVLMPRLEFLRAIMQQHLVPMYDSRLILDFEMPEVNDAEHRLNVMKASAWAYTRDEWRMEAGKAPTNTPAGDVFIMGVNQIERPADQTEPVQPNSGQEQLLLDNGEVVQVIGERVTDEIVDKLHKEINKRIRNR